MPMSKLRNFLDSRHVKYLTISHSLPTPLRGSPLSRTYQARSCEDGDRQN